MQTPSTRKRARTGEQKITTTTTTTTTSCAFPSQLVEKYINHLRSKHQELLTAILEPSRTNPSTLLNMQPSQSLQECSKEIAEACILLEFFRRVQKQPNNKQSDKLAPEDFLSNFEFANDGLAMASKYFQVLKHEVPFFAQEDSKQTNQSQNKKDLKLQSGLVAIHTLEYASQIDNTVSKFIRSDIKTFAENVLAQVYSLGLNSMEEWPVELIRQIIICRQAVLASFCPNSLGFFITLQKEDKIFNTLFRSRLESEILKNDVCSICLCNFYDNQFAAQTYCDHFYHAQCFQKLYPSNHNDLHIACPLCKTPVDCLRSYMTKYFMIQNIKPQQQQDSISTASAIENTAPDSDQHQKNDTNNNNADSTGFRTLDITMTEFSRIEAEYQQHKKNLKEAEEKLKTVQNPIYQVCD